MHVCSSEAQAAHTMLHVHMFSINSYPGSALFTVSEVKFLQNQQINSIKDAIQHFLHIQRNRTEF